MDWHELRREPVADCRVFSVERSVAVSPSDGGQHTFFRIRAAEWAQILPITPAGDAVLVRQYRHGTQRQTLEIPAGLVEPGEAPAVAAARECLEETGYRAASVKPLGVLAPNPALQSNRLHTFYAQGVERIAEIAQTPTEQTAVILVPVRELPRLLISGEIDHALCAAALWRYLYEHAQR